MKKALENLKVTISGSDDAKKFVDHFQTGTSVKNLVIGLGFGAHDDIFKAAIKDEKLADIILNDTASFVSLLNITNTVMVAYAAKCTEDRNNGNTQNLQNRVKWFIGQFAAEVDKSGDEICAAINNAYTTKNGAVTTLARAFAKDSANTKDAEQKFIPSAIMCSAVRTLLSKIDTFTVATDADGRDVKADVIVGDSASAAHTADDVAGGSSDKTTDVVVVDEGDVLAKLMEEIRAAKTQEEKSALVKRLRPESAGIISGFFHSLPAELETSGEIYDYVKIVLEGLFPENKRNDEVTSLIKTFSGVIQQMGVHQFYDYDSNCVVCAWAASMMCHLLTIAHSTNVDDIVAGYKVVLGMYDIQKSGASAEAAVAQMMTVVSKDVIAACKKVCDMLPTQKTGYVFMGAFSRGISEDAAKRCMARAQEIMVAA